jgi:hypothetical protein
VEWGGLTAYKEPIVSPRIAFRTSIIVGLIAWAAVTALYIWPALRALAPADAVRPLLVLHSFRYVGLAFLVPGMVSAEMPQEFARPAALGDLAAALLALLALGLLGTPLGVLAVWLFNICGSADLLYAFPNAYRLVAARKLLPSHFGAAYFILALYVPLLLITHGLIFWMLVVRF